LTNNKNKIYCYNAWSIILHKKMYLALIFQLTWQQKQISKLMAQLNLGLSNIACYVNGSLSLFSNWLSCTLYIISSSDFLSLFDKQSCIHLRYTIWWLDILLHCKMIITIKLISQSICKHPLTAYFACSCVCVFVHVCMWWK
jgi:hypothetical protein